METSGVVYEVDCKNCFKKYTGKTGRKLKERMNEHRNDEEKMWKYKKPTGLSQHSPAWDDVRFIEKIPGKIESSKKKLE